MKRYAAITIVLMACGCGKTETTEARAPQDGIYLEEPNGRELVAAALIKARSEQKNVLIEFGGNWCSFCYKLHDVFHDDPLVHPIIEESFELVLIDSKSNRELLEEYGGKERLYSFPHLVVLDGTGEVLTNQETSSLESGSQHDPRKVANFLTAWTVQNAPITLFNSR
jgi:thioredoxin-related protein